MELSLSKPWDLFWSDEFSGSTLDTGSWTAEVMPDPHNEELQYYTDRINQEENANIWQEDGHLIIEGRAENYRHRHYTSGRLISFQKREFLYGRFEARMKLPNEIGTWPAFWLLGNSIETKGWPACGEIDIMEGKGRLPNWVSSAIHFGPDYQHRKFFSKAFQSVKDNFQNEWHIFSVEWVPNQIQWFVDGQVYHTVKKEEVTERDPAYWPFDHGHPYYIIFNLALGGWFDKPNYPPENMLPQRLYVDYVRVYTSTRTDQ